MKTKTWIALLCVAVVLCGGLSVWFLVPGEQASRIQIKSEGEVLYILDLGIDQELTVATATGSNTVTIRDGAVAVTAADCPDHYCMHRGFCSGGSAIVCLPNRLVIEFLGEPEIDGIVG